MASSFLAGHIKNNSGGGSVLIQIQLRNFLCSTASDIFAIQSIENNSEDVVSPRSPKVWCFGHAYFCDQVACTLIVWFLFKDALYTEYSLCSFKGKKTPNKQIPKTTPKTWRWTFPSWLTEHSCKQNTNESILEMRFLKH